MKGSTIGPNTPYNYDDSAGQESRVYVIDSGLTASHPQFLSASDIEWLWAGPFEDTTKDDADTDDGHGTAVSRAQSVNKTSLRILDGIFSHWGSRWSGEESSSNRSTL